MSHLILFVVLWLKHGILANALDWGYTSSRQKSFPRYVASLAGHVTVELLLTLCVTSTLPWTQTLPLLFAEGWVQVMSCLVERQAGLYQLLRYHLICELTLVGVYLCLVFFPPLVAWLCP